MSRPKILDLFCGAGGAARGYHDAGFDVVGVDIEPQRRYPYKFYQRDVLRTEIQWSDFIAVHASPPCKVHTALKAFSAEWHMNLIPQTRELLDSTGLPYVIENVPGAPLRPDVTLCGSMFRLGVRRHRLFELGGWVAPQPSCDHAAQETEGKRYLVKRYHSGTPEIHPSAVIGVYGRGQGLGPGELQMWRDAMGIQWMMRDELSQAIPPAYTEYLGRHLMKEVAE